MSKPRGREHTTLTETAALVVKELYKVPGIKMIAPGEINTASRRKGGKRFITVIKTTAGYEMIVTGQSVQKIAVHADNNVEITAVLQNAKTLREFTISERSRFPGQ